MKIETPTKRCEVCRKIVNVFKEQIHEILFFRNMNQIEAYFLCMSCFNKYLLEVRKDILPEDYYPEKDKYLKDNLESNKSNTIDKKFSKKIKIKSASA